MSLEESPRRLSYTEKAVRSRRKDEQAKIAELLKTGWVLKSDVPFKLEHLFQGSVSAMDKFFAEILKGLTPAGKAGHIQNIGRSPYVSRELYEGILEKARGRFKLREVISRHSTSPDLPPRQD